MLITSWPIKLIISSATIWRNSRFLPGNASWNLRFLPRVVWRNSRFFRFWRYFDDFFLNIFCWSIDEIDSFSWLIVRTYFFRNQLTYIHIFCNFLTKFATFFLELWRLSAADWQNSQFVLYKNLTIFFSLSHPNIGICDFFNHRLKKISICFWDFEDFNYIFQHRLKTFTKWFGKILQKTKK